MRVLLVAALLSGCRCGGESEAGVWVCPGGGTWTARPDGTVVGTRDMRVGDPFEAGHGQVCATIGQQTCAKAIAVPPELVSRWAHDIRTHWLLDATVVEIRGDGYAWVRYYDGPPAAQGQILFVGDETFLQMCDAPVALPITVRDKAITWEGSAMSRVDAKWYEDLTEEELRRLEELSRGIPGETDWHE